MGKEGSSGGSSRFWSYLLIVCYAAAIVALGVHEVNGRFKKRRWSNKDANNIISPLKNDLKARLDPDMFEKNSVGKTGQRGSWKREDQNGLQKLLNKVAP